MDCILTNKFIHRMHEKQENTHKGEWGLMISIFRTKCGSQLKIFSVHEFIIAVIRFGRKITTFYLGSYSIMLNNRTDNSKNLFGRHECICVVVHSALKIHVSLCALCASAMTEHQTAANSIEITIVAILQNIKFN